MEYTYLEVAKILNVSKSVIKYRATLLPDDQKEKKGEQWFITEEGLKTIQTMLKKTDIKTPSDEPQEPPIYVHIRQPGEEPEPRAQRPEPQDIPNQDTITPDQRAWYEEQIKQLQKTIEISQNNLDHQQQLHFQYMKEQEQKLALQSGENEHQRKVDTGKNILIAFLVVVIISLIGYFAWYIS